MEFETGIVAKQPYKGLTIRKASFDKAIIFDDKGTMSLKPTITVELEVEGRKHPIRKDVIYTYCPFCGQPFETKPVEAVTNA